MLICRSLETRVASVLHFLRFCPPEKNGGQLWRKRRTIMEDTEDNFGGHFRHLIAQELHLCKIKAFFMQIQVHYKGFFIFKPFLLIFFYFRLIQFQPPKKWNFKYILMNSIWCKIKAFCIQIDIYYKVFLIFNPFYQFY